MGAYRAARVEEPEVAAAPWASMEPLTPVGRCSRMP